MTSNIGCSFTGCNSPVIGQCSGYKGNCGQFYCRTHSFGKLCSECGRREATDLTYEHYLETAKRIVKPGIFASAKKQAAYENAILGTKRQCLASRSFTYS